MHTPTSVTDRAVSVAKEKMVDSIVFVGGGSTTGLGKVTEERRKVTRRDPRALPQGVVHDIGLTRSLPTKLSIHSGINAIAHAALTSHYITSCATLWAAPLVSRMLKRTVTVMPRAVAYNAPAVPRPMAKLASALPDSDGDAVKGSAAAKSIRVAF
ncbi:hypothetical protein EDB81DRAFT_756414 [Dactylonectria macrodidyma]|uniref:Alcohol dehydrogenase iron-type/glycerol dehydrogenase GldA domain-containing protein n=1 Tax=Dactylonectria macrodidyma TaxID=307937 RepID=A0A9P9FH07_9HYPO|nr:hypothetical protein EDB81DRAFT_756414 [Dactylonectria macrodidyma]